jgi:ABC-type nitrate/sulfonate/bicarbonate transport system substrate-binding protein
LGSSDRRWLLFFLPVGAWNGAIGAEPFKKMRVAIPSIVIDFAPLWIARDKGLFREEGAEVEITYIQGNIRGVQSLLAGEVQAGIAGSAGPIGARAAGEDAVIVAVPMNRLDYTFVAPAGKEHRRSCRQENRHRRCRGVRRMRTRHLH